MWAEVEAQPEGEAVCVDALHLFLWEHRRRRGQAGGTTRKEGRLAAVLWPPSRGFLSYWGLNPGALYR